MKDKYIVDLIPKRLDDRVFSEIIGLAVCNRETQYIFTITIIVIACILISTSVLHLSLLSIKKGEKTNISIPFNLKAGPKK
jgi:hypothetical protein